MPRRKQSHPQPVKCGGGAEPLGSGASTVVLESDLLLSDDLELCGGTERLLSFSRDSEDSVESKLEIPRYPLSEDEYSAYQPLSTDSDPEEAGVGGLPSPCGPCESTESSRCQYQEHHEDVTSEKERLLFTCRLCPFSTHYSSHLKRHMKTHNGEKPFCCPHCLYASSQLVNLKRHLLTHTGEKPFHCELCTFSCSSPGNLKRHQKVHTQDKPFTCHLCPYRCNQSRNLKRHILAHRRGQQKERREEAKETRSSPPPDDVSVAALALPVTSDDLEVFLPACVHLSRAPSSPVLQPTADDGLPELLFPFTCRSCGTVLDEGSPQDDDGEMDGQFCSRCSSSGSPDKCFSCVLCPFVTHYQNHLSRHMKTHSGEKPYKCHLCSYASAHYDNLKRHQRVHTGEKPYKCQLCDYACGNLANLKRHGRIHSGDKPFRCGLCNYSCNQSMNLKRHMLRHTGEKPLRCPQCHYTTGHWDNYKRHQKTHGHSGELSEPPRSDGS
ncbi:zinc finger protein 513 [Rana temporaria]|uniref:zinc finger protein 513 n=1 Tax=Rana temporaria TaxID=8407 RepID=UPI001AAD2A9B|nr:zinc finger protein 513 [Rana temporaria]